MRKGMKDSKRVLVTFSPEMHAALIAFAEEKHMPVAFLVRECVMAMYAHLLKKTEEVR